MDGTNHLLGNGGVGCQKNSLRLLNSAAQSAPQSKVLADQLNSAKKGRRV
jgi:hypothetical protein